MKRILSWVLPIFFLFALTASAEESTRQMYINSDMNMVLYIDQATLQYASAGNVLLTEEPLYADESPSGFMATFYVLDDANVFENESMADYEEALQAVKKYATPVLAFAMQNASDTQVPGELADMEPQIVREGEKTYRMYKISDDAYNAMNEEKRRIADTTLNCFSDLSASMEIMEPSDTVLGSFSAKDINGNSYTQEVFSGHKLTMINIWATYCPPCLEEMPFLAEIADEYSDKGVQIIGIVSDVREGSGPEDEMVLLAKDIAQETGAINYLHLIPDSVMIINKLKDVTLVPTTFFVDENGKQVGQEHVRSYSKDEWIRIIEDTLALVN